MSGLQVEAQMHSAVLMAQLDEIADAGGDWTQAWTPLGKAWWFHRQRNVFDTNGLRRWAPLKFKTLKEKKRIGSVGTTLVRTGILFRQVASPIPVKAQPRYGVFGAGTPRVSYLNYHVKGRHVPQRNPVPRISVAERRSLILEMQRLYVERVKKAVG